MIEEEIETNPPDLLGDDNICECGASEWIDTGGVTEHQRILECNKCGKIVYGCD